MVNKAYLGYVVLWACTELWEARRGTPRLTTRFGAITHAPSDPEDPFPLETNVPNRYPGSLGISMNYSDGMNSDFLEHPENLVSLVQDFWPTRRGSPILL